jgi:hemoglobin
VTRPTIYDHLGGAPALEAFVAALHERCVADPFLEHPFSHGLDPDHLPHLAAYLAEVFGGPVTYSTTLGGHSAMLEVHAGAGADEAFNDAFVTCFMAAADDVHLPNDAEFRAIWRDYVESAVLDVFQYSPIGARVPTGLAMPRWSWNGPENLN